jgi:AcrR family transcriptional regulator
VPESTRQKRSRKKFVRKTKSERQREIVEATVQLVGKYGVQGTTVSRIAAAVGIARGALYQHFPNREAVLEAALASMGERSSAWLAQSSGPDVPARLLGMGEAHSSWSLSEYNTFVRPFFQLIASNRETSLTRLIIERQQTDLRYLVELVEEGKRQGTIASEVESRDIAWSLLLHAWGEDIARLMGVDQFITEGASNRILRRLLDTYTVDPAPPAREHTRSEARS